MVVLSLSERLVGWCKQELRCMYHPFLGLFMVVRRGFHFSYVFTLFSWRTKFFIFDRVGYFHDENIV